MSESRAGSVRPPPDPVGCVLFHVARGLAAVGGLLLVVVALMSVASIASRALLGTALLGDFELVQIGCAVAVASFLPWGQMRGSHVRVDCFTATLRPGRRAALDGIGAGLLGACAALIAWRMLVGAFELYASRETSMLLGVPIWGAYATMIPSFVLLALTAFYTSWRSFRGEAA